MKKKKALIIGISGQDGSYLAKLLLDKGYEVIGTSRDAGLSSFQNLKALGVFDKICLESVSLNDFHSVLQTLKKHRPNEVYNLAGQSSVGLSFDQPVETFESISLAFLNLLEAIRFLGAPTRLYNAGSSECFGNTNGIPADESTPFRPRSPYGVAKSAAFWHAANYREAYGMYVCSGILFNHESPLRPPRFVTRKIVDAACRIKSGSKESLLLGNISIRRDWGWAPEFVNAMWLMLQQEKPDDFVIATGESNPLEDFVREVFLCLNLDWKEHVSIGPNLSRPAEIAVSAANTQKAERILGWKAAYKMKDVARMMVQTNAPYQPD